MWYISIICIIAALWLLYLSAGREWYNAPYFAVSGGAGEQNGMKSKYNSRFAAIIPENVSEDKSFLFL